MDCSSYWRDQRERKRMKRLIKKAASEAVTAAEANKMQPLEAGLTTQISERNVSNLNLDEMEIVQITLPIQSGQPRGDQQPQIAFLVKKNQSEAVTASYSRK